jgi:hypothetical protein
MKDPRSMHHHILLAFSHVSNHETVLREEHLQTYCRFHSGTVDVSVFLVCGATSLGDWCAMFRDSVAVSRVEMSMKMRVTRNFRSTAVQCGASARLKEGCRTLAPLPTPIDFFELGFCRHDAVKKFTRFSLQRKLVSEINWWATELVLWKMNIRSPQLSSASRRKPVVSHIKLT